jgi:DNA (cytosine-5)-methyltransferase 1
MKDYHVQTYRHNLGDHIVMKDIMQLTESDIPEIDIVVAGIPCVRFSSLNTTNNIRDDESDTYNLIEQTLNIIRWSKAKSFLFENVRNFLSVKEGLFLDRIKAVWRHNY